MRENRTPNRLIYEGSPYLQQHAYNPVDWHPWGPEALERAKTEDKSIFLSIGYSSCHWCHVMEHESFANDEIALIMNENFVSIKVDREERPDLDQIYQTICQVVTRSGGWPLSVFLSPDQKPFYVGTYFPPTERYGRAGFKQVLIALTRAYREKRDEVARVSENWTGAIAQAEAVPDPAEAVPPRSLVAEAAQALAQRVDMENGGFGGAPKFPNTFNLEVLLRQYGAAKDRYFLDLVTFTLEKMAEGGIYDHLGGGFHRYSVDAAWAVPHFEKMLYDNAVLPPLYLSAWQATGEPLFRQVAEETLQYVLREMTHPDGGFYSSTDADSEGEEGKFFVFDRAEVFEAVGPDLGDLICRHFGVTMDGNFEQSGKTVLHIAETPEQLANALGEPADQFRVRLAEGRRRLLANRERRVPPFRDEKVLTAWNGLMISAFARGGRILREPRYSAAAERAATFVLERLTAPNGDLLRRFKGGKAGITGYLEDYAYLVAALLDLYEATFDERWLHKALHYAQETVTHFYDGNGSFYLTRADGERLIHRPKDATDASTPAGSSVAVSNLLRLAPFTGAEEHRTIPEAVFRTYHSHMNRMPGGMGTLLYALDLYHAGPTEVTLVGDAPEEWLERLGRIFLPNLVLTRTAGARDQAPIWAGKAMARGKPTAYVCRNFTCSPPATEWAELERYLYS